ncbi:hypothetical protein [Gordonia soli]|uniref:SnoaL-like domain-containing protein n=1 Tax=Gordonia soli NBRC 108243 TaxID=1223545 RepID=M0QG46_9ACTN|nr:hypothetical protein [Gordonia soli]GAC67558.1 hypothetical protein GS4_08_01430 [Gordonia soli NBRC 108243]
MRPTTDDFDEQAQLQARVADMYSAVFHGDYASAYQFRSSKCKDGFPQARYVASMRDLLGDKPYPHASVDVTITAQSDSSAQVRVAQPGPGFPGGQRTWVQTDGVWYFDNCQARNSGSTP